ncbi:MAG: Hsp70 family protein [Victivallales bacterium]|nr:Hsp70 family protein [Victivallales bacterium]
MRYLIGIDLGTTNSVVYYIDTAAENPVPQLFKIPQVVAPGETRALGVLPSAVYLPDEGAYPAAAFALPWCTGADFAVGEFARANAAREPDRTVVSAKSWLCAEEVDRRAAVLPPGRNNPARQISPLEATRRILAHIRDAWNYVMAEADIEALIEEQQIILTVPASFDAVARELTVEAARAAGLTVVLLEEPLAAFYAWLHRHTDSWRTGLVPGDVVLVCDIGGGTSDFSLIRAIDRDGNLELERVAVGRHILLGGDNMDLAAAYNTAVKLQQERNLQLDQYQIMGLTYACRRAKEKMLDDPNVIEQPLTVLGRGSSVIGGTITTRITAAELKQMIVDGFFPVCGLDERPRRNPRAGLRTYGLRYESDPAVTLHLAELISRHCTTPELLPNRILFNGGVTKAKAVRERLLQTVRSWLGAGAELRELAGTDPDLAVSRGGCAYALVRRGRGVRVRAGSSHAYYIGIESTLPAIPGFRAPVQALCLAPIGAEEGTGSDIPYDGLGLVVGEDVSFRFFGSTERQDDVIGTILPDADKDPALFELPALTATLPAADEVPAGSLIPVTLHGDLTETGTLQLWCIEPATGKRWRLEFELRSTTVTAHA